jgi:ferredoxin
MKVTVDYDRCQGHWVCVSEAPEVFAGDEKKGQVVVLNDSPAEELRAKVAAAVKYCPTRALAILEDANAES